MAYSGTFPRRKQTGNAFPIRIPFSVVTPVNGPEDAASLRGLCGLVWHSSYSTSDQLPQTGPQHHQAGQHGSSRRRQHSSGGHVLDDPDRLLLFLGDPV